MQIVMTPQILLAAYAQGLFPMAESGHSRSVQWICPEMRGQISISDMHIPRRLCKNLRHMKIGGLPYDIRINSNFNATIKFCAESSENRQETWINQEIVKAYCALHDLGHAHSVECWQNDMMVGGLYGVSIGGAFFGESMFSRQRDASKVALAHLVARLFHAGYQLLDTQFTNTHLEQFGVYELSYHEYMKQLECALPLSCAFEFEAPSEDVLMINYLNSKK